MTFCMLLLTFVRSQATPTPTSTASAQGSGDDGSSGPSGGDSGAQNDDPQSSLTLLQSVIATGFENDGQDQ